MTKTPAPVLNWMSLAGAALAAPTASWVVFLAGSLVMALFQQPVVGPDPLALIGMLVIWTLLIAAWGFLPAMLFGGAAMALVERWAVARGVPVYVVAGLVAAAVYLTVGVLFAEVWPTGAFLIAPWAMMMDYPPDGQRSGTASVAAVAACILTAGAFGGWLYRRLAQRC